MEIYYTIIYEVYFHMQSHWGTLRDSNNNRLSHSQESKDYIMNMIYVINV